MSIDVKAIQKAIDILVKAIKSDHNHCLLCSSKLPTAHYGRQYCHKSENPECAKEHERLRKREQRQKGIK
jgi:hypothetical protein